MDFDVNVDLDVGCCKPLVVGEYGDVRECADLAVCRGVGVSEWVVAVGRVGDLDVRGGHRVELLEHVERERLL